MKEYILDKTEHQKILILTDLHFCDSVWYHTDSAHRMDLLCEIVNREYEQNPFDAILCLGDYSLDFWMWETKGSWLRNPPVSYTRKFVQEVIPRLPMHPYMIPGNHEQYGPEKWEEITGFPRQYSIVWGDRVFLMCDTFAGNLDPTEHSDGTYTGIDTAFVREVMEKHPDKTLILCLHELMPDRESAEARELIGGCDRILCAFTGHTHKSDTHILDAGWNHLPVFYCGDFAFSLGCRADTLPNWGFRRVDFTDGFSTNYQPCLQLAPTEAKWGED